MSKTLVPRRMRATRLDFDGGPWVGGYPLSWSSPWAELAVAAVGGLLLGLYVLPDPAPIRAIGMVGWAVAAPLAAVASIGTWMIDGVLRWPLGAGSLGPLGWAVLSVAIADLLQAVLPLTFGRRVLASAAGGPAGAFLLIGGLSLLPWHLLPWAG
ncbi:MAG TPA: hypothetical protein VM840_07560 [Actinomycetota bacterium]|nr:hypothetical protein [Actinomycetota bacterium]